MPLGKEGYKEGHMSSDTTSQSDEQLFQSIRAAGCTLHERSQLIRLIRSASWAYQVLITEDQKHPLLEEDIDHLISCIIEGQFATSWVYKVQVWDDSHRKETNTHRLTPYQSSMLARAYR